MAQYKMINIALKNQDPASYLEGLANQMSKDGWEFQRVDEIGSESSPGCLGGLLGQKASYSTYYVATFKR